METINKHLVKQTLESSKSRIWNNKRRYN